MRLFPSSLQTAARPRMACEIAPDGILAGGSAHADSPLDAAVFAPLAAGSISVGIQAPLFPDNGAMLTELRGVLDAVNPKGRDWTVVVPDGCARVHILDFDTLPTKPQEVLPLVRFRLRRMLPFDADQAAVSYQLLKAASTAGQEGPVQVIVAAMPGEIREEVESLMRSVQREPGVVLPATLAAVAALPDAGSHLLVHTEKDSLTTVIAHNGELKLYRTTERVNTDPGEMAQAILVAAAYFEDILQVRLDEVWVAGLETPDELRQQLQQDGTWQIPLRSPVNSQTFAAGVVPSQVEPRRFTSVVGALAG